MRLKTMAIKCLMAEKDVNTVELAKLAGVSRNTISSSLNGKSCSLSTVAKLSMALNVSLIEIAEE